MDAPSKVLLSPRCFYRFDFARTYFTRRAGELVDRVEEGSYRRLFTLPGGPVLAIVSLPEPESAAPSLRCVAAGEHPSAPSDAAVHHIAATLRRTLGLDEETQPIEDCLRCDPAFAPLVEEYRGLRLVSTPSPFEAFVWAVLGQQISLLVAFKLKAALVRRCGLRAVVDGVDYWDFPATGVLAAENPAELAALGVGTRKAATIVNTARAIESGTLDLDALGAMPLEEAEARLVALHGVGPWTARYTLLRGLRHVDACPVSDMGLRVACGLLGNADKATVAEVEASAERWRPFRGYAAFYLWFMLANRLRRADG